VRACAQGGHLSKRINLCRSVSQLAELVQSSRGKLDPVHLALVAKRLEMFVHK